MKLSFVLDENVIICAQTRSDPRGQPDETCFRLIGVINQICHRMVWSMPIYARYRRQLHTRSDRATRPGLLSLLQDVLLKAEKNTPVADDESLATVPAGEARPGVDPGDLDFVRAAACVPGAVLVTYDDPLRQALAAESLPTKLGFSVVTPGQALELAIHAA